MINSSKISWQKIGFLLVLLLPAFIFYILFALWPNLLSAYYSLMEWNGVAAPKFVGLQNFVKMMSDRNVWRGLKINLLIMVITVPLTLIIALLLAFSLTNTKFRENKLYKILFFLPNVLPSVVIALMWSFIFDGNIGLLNGLLRMINRNLTEKYWLADKNLALYCIMIPMIWCNVGFHMIIYMNAMDAIPASMYEAAVLEGSGPLQKLRYVTLPLIRETITTSAVFLILGAFRNYEMILLMTGGGPSGATTSLGLYMFTLAFGLKGVTTHWYGYSSAVGMLLMVLLIAIKLFMEKWIKTESVQY